MRSQQWVITDGSDLGRAIADIRNGQGLTQLELAESAGLTRSYVAQIESGRTVRLLDHVLRLLRRMGAEVTVTFPDRGGRTSKPR